MTMIIGFENIHQKQISASPLQSKISKENF
jgi:hypothetical protein